MGSNAQNQIKVKLAEADMGSVEAIRPPLTVIAGASRSASYVALHPGLWLALVALAGIIILACIIGIIVICFTWARYSNLKNHSSYNNVNIL